MNKILITSIIIASAIAVGMAIGGCVFTNELSDTGKEIQKLDRQITRLRETNTLLSEEIASRSSVMTILHEARLLGLTTTIHTETIGPMSVALQTVR